MRKYFQFVLFFILACVYSHAASISRTGSCSATTTSCTLSATAKDDVRVVFAIRSGNTTPPALPAGWMPITTGTGTSSSFRVGCNESNASTDTGTGTWTNATDVQAISYAGSSSKSSGAVAQDDCASAIGAFAASSGTTSTITYPGITLNFTDNTSWVVGFSGSSAAVCTPTGMTVINTAGNSKSNDTNATATAWASTNCTGTTGNWVSIVLEIVADRCANLVTGTWTCVQHVGKYSCAASPCSITVASTAAGHIGILTSGMSAATPPKISSISGGANAWTLGTCQATDSTTTSQIDQAYNLNLSAGVTSIAVTLSGTPSAGFLDFIELSNTGTVSFDTCTATDHNANSTAPAGAALTPSGSDDVIVQAIQPASRAVAVNSSYAWQNMGGNGGGYKVTTSGTAPTWTTDTSAHSIVIGTALKAVALTACTAFTTITLLGTGCL